MGPNLIIYDPESKPLSIVRVVHMALVMFQACFDGRRTPRSIRLGVFLLLFAVSTSEAQESEESIPCRLIWEREASRAVAFRRCMYCPRRLEKEFRLPYATAIW